MLDRESEGGNIRVVSAPSRGSLLSSPTTEVMLTSYFVRGWRPSRTTVFSEPSTNTYNGGDSQKIAAKGKKYTTIRRSVSIFYWTKTSRTINNNKTKSMFTIKQNHRGWMKNKLGPCDYIQTPERPVELMKPLIL